MWHEVARLDDIVPGGTKYVRVGEEEICLCNYEGTVFAVSRRCGHQNAPLEQGALEGWVITCPLHDAQFDVRTGKNLSWPIDHYFGEEELSEAHRRFERLEKRLQWKTRVHDLATFPARVTDAGAIEVEVD